MIAKTGSGTPDGAVTAAPGHEENRNGEQTIASSQDSAETRTEKANAAVSQTKSGPPAIPQTMFGRVQASPLRRGLIFFGLCLGLFLSLMDTSIMATAIYTIALDFNSLAKAFWAILSYQLAYLGFATVFARLSDFIGRRVAVISAFILFIAFSLGCGWAQNVDQLIAFRTIQGIGGAGLYSMSIILIVEASTAKLMPFTSSLIGATIAISGVLGPILGGVLTQYASWRWIFWINGPTGALAVACFTIGWPNDASATAYAGSKRRWREFDWPGAILILAASVLVVFGIQEAGTGSYGWSSPLVLGTLISGCLSWVLLLAWEYYVYLHHRDTIASMFPVSILLNRPLLLGIVSTMLTGFSYLLIIVALPLRFQIVNLRTPAAAGTHLLPLLCATGLGSFLGGTVSSKKNRVSETFVVGGSLILLGVGLLTTLGSGESIEAKCYGFQILLGLGVGSTFSAISIMTAISSDRGTHSVAQGIAAQVRIFGGSIGVAATNALFNASCSTKLRGILTPSQIADLQTSTRILISLDAASREAVRLAYSDSFRTSLKVCCIVAGLSILVSLGTWQKNPPLVASQQLQRLKELQARQGQKQDQTLQMEESV